MDRETRDTAAPAAPPEDDFDAELSAALDRIEAGEQQPDADGESPEEAPARDEHGRFAKRELEETDAGSATTLPGNVAPSLEFPEHWSEERRSLISGLPAEHRETVFSQWRDLEAEHSNRQRELAERQKAIEPLLATLEPLRSQMATQGIAPEVALQSFLAGMQRLRANPEQGLFELAEQVGRPLAGSASARDLIRRLSSTLGVEVGASPDDPAASADEWLDPRAAREVTALRSQLSGLQQQLATFTEQQQQTAMQTAQQQAQAFAEAKAADGSPLYPHFATVKQRMAQAIGSGMAPDLESAYQTAVWSDPAIRQQLLDAERKAEVAKREADRKASVAKAKAATAPAGHSRPGGSAPAEDRTLDDALAGAVDKLLMDNAA